VVNGNGTVNLDMKVNTLPQAEFPPAPVRDEFNGSQPALYWNFLRNPNPADYSWTEKKGWLKLTGNNYTLDSTASPAFIGRRQQHYNCTAEVKMEFNPANAGEEAGLTVFMNNQHYYTIAVRKEADGQIYLLLEERVGRVFSEPFRVAVSNSDFYLKISSHPDTYYFSYSLDGKKYMTAGEADTRLLSSEVAGGFTGVYFGMYASGNGKRSESPAWVDWFEYKH
jgi:alpha-N-arabinofuranosidase